jgi:hypothetical protein
MLQVRLYSLVNLSNSESLDISEVGLESKVVTHNLH